jgi:hypothetical protein
MKGTYLNMKTNSPVSYYAIPVKLREVNGKLRTIKNKFDIYEVRDGNHIFIARMSNGGDRLQNILKRGIPTEFAQKVFYEMDD